MYLPVQTALRKHAHAIYRDFLAVKIENFQLKNFNIFLIFAQKIDYGYMLERSRRKALSPSKHLPVMMGLCLRLLSI